MIPLINGTIETTQIDKEQKPALLIHDASSESKIAIAVENNNWFKSVTLQVNDGIRIHKVDVNIGSLAKHLNLSKMNIIFRAILDKLGGWGNLHATINQAAERIEQDAKNRKCDAIIIDKLGGHATINEAAESREEATKTSKIFSEEELVRENDAIVIVAHYDRTSDSPEFRKEGRTRFYPHLRDAGELATLIFQQLSPKDARDFYQDMLNDPNITMSMEGGLNTAYKEFTQKKS